jgi:hypothetical protein
VLSAPAWSATYTFATAPGAQTFGAGTTGFNVDISGTFDVNLLTHQITISLLNLEDNPARDFQLLGSASITLTNLDHTVVTAPSLVAGSASFEAIDVTPAISIPSQPANAWLPQGSGAAGAYTEGPNILSFCADCPTNGGSKQLLIGGPNPSTGNYDNPALNSSITGPGHQPWILASGVPYSSGPLAGLTAADTSPTWVINVPQLTANSTITGVTFGFGTAWGQDTALGVLQSGQDPPPTGAPEPGAGLLMLTGCLLIGGSVHFKHRGRSAK